MLNKCLFHLAQRSATVRRTKKENISCHIRWRIAAYQPIRVKPESVNSVMMIMTFIFEQMSCYFEGAMGVHCNREVARQMTRLRFNESRTKFTWALPSVSRLDWKSRLRFFARTPEKKFSLTWAEKSLMFIVYSVKSVLKLKVVIV